MCGKSVKLKMNEFIKTKLNPFTAAHHRRWPDKTISVKTDTLSMAIFPFLQQMHMSRVWQRRDSCGKQILSSHVSANFIFMLNTRTVYQVPCETSAASCTLCVYYFFHTDTHSLRAFLYVFFVVVASHCVRCDYIRLLRSIPQHFFFPISMLGLFVFHYSLVYWYQF